MTISGNGRDIDKTNPFQNGMIVTGRSFVGRESELVEAYRLIRAGKSVLISSDPRMGKSSFLAELARRHSKNFAFIQLDLYGMTDETRFLELMTRRLMSAHHDKGGAFNPSAWGMLRSSRLKLAILEQENLTRPTAEEMEFLPPPPADGGNRAGGSRNKSAVIRMCPKCGKPLKWVEKYGRSYCYNCRKYMPKKRRAKKSLLIQDSYIERFCPLCGEDTFFVEKYEEHYCENCKKYPFVSLRHRIADKFTASDVMEVLDLPQMIAANLERPVVLMFDDCQELASLENRSLLRTVKARCGLQPDVVYVFAGNKSKELSSIFDDKDAPFAKFAQTIELGPIPDDEMEKFLVDRFRAAEGRLGKAQARRIVALSGRCPYYIQLIAHELVHISREPTDADLEKAVATCITLKSHTYKQLWESIRSPLQRRYLIASVTEPRATHSSDFVSRHSLRSRSHVQRTENQLEAKGIVKDGEVVDPMFVLWLRAMADLR